MAFDDLASDYDALLNPKEVVEQMYKKKLPVVFGPITEKNVEQVKVSMHDCCVFSCFP